MKVILEKLTGNVLAIGLDDTLKKILEANINIDSYTYLDTIKNSKGSKKSSKTKAKNIKVKKIKKYFKRKSIDYIICDYNSIKKYNKTIIRDIVYLNRQKAYFYGNIDMDLLKKFKRYKTDIKVDKKFVEIDNQNSKNNFFKDKAYYIIDTISNLRDLLADLLLN